MSNARSNDWLAPFVPTGPLSSRAATKSVFQYLRFLPQRAGPPSTLLHPEVFPEHTSAMYISI